jgi:hypothetical protein
MNKGDTLLSTIISRATLNPSLTGSTPTPPHSSGAAEIYFGPEPIFMFHFQPTPPASAQKLSALRYNGINARLDLIFSDLSCPIFQLKNG